jgi:hypothetical protein
MRPPREGRSRDAIGRTVPLGCAAPRAGSREAPGADHSPVDSRARTPPPRARSTRSPGQRSERRLGGGEASETRDRASSGPPRRDRPTRSTGLPAGPVTAGTLGAVGSVPRRRTGRLRARVDTRSGHQIRPGSRHRRPSPRRSSRSTPRSTVARVERWSGRRAPEQPYTPPRFYARDVLSTKRLLE